MEVSNELHASTSLIPAKKTHGSRRIGGSVGPTADLEVSKNKKQSFAITRIPDGQTHSLVTTLTELSLSSLRTFIFF